MKNVHKYAYRLILLAECLTKVEEIYLLGYLVKIFAYLIIVLADSKVDFIKSTFPILLACSLLTFFSEKKPIEYVHTVNCTPLVETSRKYHNHISYSKI